MTGISVLLIGGFDVGNQYFHFPTVIGAVISAAIVKLLQFFIFNVDYSRTEYVQFEDDEYYYYVKAVPKIAVAKPSKTVKKITSQKKDVAQPPHT